MACLSRAQFIRKGTKTVNIIIVILIYANARVHILLSEIRTKQKVNQNEMS